MTRHVDARNGLSVDCLPSKALVLTHQCPDGHHVSTCGQSSLEDAIVDHAVWRILRGTLGPDA